jgi:transcriptional regulator with XRE-family HTH domain
VLLQNLENLGEGGEAEVDRIIAAAQRMGIEFEGLSDLINSTFAPQTLEEMKESLGLTGEEVRALAEKLGVDLQTNLERSAQQMGLTVDELKALQDAAGQALGSEGAASMEELQALMDAMGLSAQDLADKLGLEIPGGAGSLADEAAKGTTEIGLAADEALRLKDNLMAAASAAAGINIPAGAPNPGGGSPGGGFASGTPNSDFMNFGAGTKTTLHGEEAVVRKGSGSNKLAAELAGALKGAGGANVTMTMAPVFNLSGSATQVDVDLIMDALDRNVDGFADRAREKLNG